MLVTMVSLALLLLLLCTTELKKRRIAKVRVMACLANWIANRVGAVAQGGELRYRRLRLWLVVPL